MGGWLFLLASSANSAPDVGAAAGRAFLVLLLLVVLLFVVARYGRGWMDRLLPRPQGEMRVLEACRLEPRRTLYLLRLRGRDFWLASHENGMELLREFDVPGGPAALEPDDAGGKGPEEAKEAASREDGRA